MAVDVAPRLCVGEAEFVGRDADYFSIFLVEPSNVSREFTLRDGNNVR
jgi:hypothetical protein